MKIYNSYTNELEEFKPIKPNNLSIYVCGPTVYNYIHIGNARPIILFDVLARYFKSLGYKINFVQNFTDIDDKIINRSNELNIKFNELSEKYIKAFLEDISNLNILEDVKRPKVSENMPEIIEMIQNLIDEGYAYESMGDVFFEVSKYSEYGKLSNQKIQDLEIGARVEENTNKKNPIDFALWKKMKEGEPYWDSPWSKGRPGWHIECSVMSKKYLGNNFDIHGGGIDLLFPHHENEIAQSRCSCHGENKFANYWMHNGFLEINGEKMSKSLGNYKLLRDILEKYDGSIIRLFMLSTHYRKPINFTLEGLDAAKRTISSIYDTLERYAKLEKDSNSNIEARNAIIEFEEKFKDAIEDDLNTPLAIASIHEFIKKINKLITIDSFKEIDYVVEKIKYYLEEVLGVKMKTNENNKLEEKLIELLNNIREEARKNRNFELSDLIRDELAKLGIKSIDGKVK
ncbi:cysteine--tRNA ligase [Pseudostreptobacillus hongkongensis]|uniref:cysteine--tRNA ligase n=1 Tax=Pseudostreptobacillus hongkongensis TaxID=1162717 RepID=UPI000831F395|nr:cysteine--tRNA ligase [Pseudostreptobacillus hongkongensis]